MVEPGEPRTCAGLPRGTVVKRARAEAEGHAGGEDDGREPRLAGLGGDRERDADPDGGEEGELVEDTTKLRLHARRRFGHEARLARR